MPPTVGDPSESTFLAKNERGDSQNYFLKVPQSRKIGEVKAIAIAAGGNLTEFRPAVGAPSKSKFWTKNETRRKWRIGELLLKVP